MKTCNHEKVFSSKDNEHHYCHDCNQYVEKETKVIETGKRGMGMCIFVIVYACIGLFYGVYIENISIALFGGILIIISFFIAFAYYDEDEMVIEGDWQVKK
jgi:hypothetical protein